MPFTLVRAAARVCAGGILMVCILHSANAQTKICSSLGGGSFALGALNAGYALTNGPFTCDGVSISGVGFLSIPNVADQSTGGGTPTSSSLTYGYGSATAASEIGFNHVSVSAGPNNNVGQSANADSAWGDVGKIVGPDGSGAVQVKFSGHLDGNGTINNSSSSSLSGVYTLAVSAVGGAGFVFYNQFNNSDEKWSAFGNASFNLPISAPRTSTSIQDSFEVTVLLPVNVSIGIQGLLSAQASNGGFGDLGHTGALDRITLPQGYGFISNGAPLQFDGTGFTYSLAAVPEPSSYALMFAGLAVIGGVARRMALNLAGHTDRRTMACVVHA